MHQFLSQNKLVAFEAFIDPYRTSLLLQTHSLGNYCRLAGKTKITARGSSLIKSAENEVKKKFS